MAEKIVVRPLQAKDAAAVRRLDRLILGRDRSKTWDAQVERFLDTADVETLPHPPFGSHVAEWQGEIVGFILSEFQAGEYGLPRGAWIVAVAVLPEMRRLGVGMLMVDALVEQCRKQGVEEVYAAVRPGDERVADFLAACGMEASRVVVYGRRA